MLLSPNSKAAINAIFSIFILIFFAKVVYILYASKVFPLFFAQVVATRERFCDKTGGDSRNLSDYPDL